MRQSTSQLRIKPHIAASMKKTKPWFEPRSGTRTSLTQADSIQHTSRSTILTPTAPPVQPKLRRVRAIAYHAMGHDAELVQVIVQIECLAWHISTGLIARLRPHMKTFSLHHLREGEQQLK